MSEERKVLVGTVYSGGFTKTSWSEWDQAFDDVIAEIARRTEERQPRSYPQEVIEVVVVRRTRLSAQVLIEPQ